MAAIMSRWISLVPPPKVRISADRCSRSIRPASSAPGEPRGRRPRRRAPPSAAGRPRSRTRCRTPSSPTPRPGRARSPRPPRRSASSAASGTPRLACTRARCSRTHSWSMAPVSVGHAGALRHAHLVRITGADDVSATRSWLSWLVISGQPAFSSATRADAGTRTSVVVGRAGAGARRPCAPWSRRSPGAAVGHDQDRQALVLLARRGRCGPPARRSRRARSGSSTSSGR